MESVPKSVVSDPFPPIPVSTLRPQRIPNLPTSLVSRPALIQRLNAGLAAGRPLTLISAPAGYGKSTLAAEWLAGAGRPVAWLALDEADDEPLRFFAGFTTAVQRAGVRWSPDLLAALAAGQMPPQDILQAALADGLAQTPAGCLAALDDFQVIQDGLIISVLNGLLAYPPTGFHLALITREDPPLPLARLRARGQLTEIRTADLRFVSAEIEHFLRQGMGLALSEGDLQQLEQRTEGWPAGLQLAGLALQAPLSAAGRKDPSSFIASLSGSHRFILGYLTEEVLNVQPLEVQSFLLQTAILSALTGELCDAVTGGSGSAALLEKLLAANLFLIPLDDEARWYRYHHLFASLLRSQLQRTQSERLPELHRRAAIWHAANGLPAEAIEHALAVPDYPQAAALLERFGWELLNQGAVRRMEAWLQALPSEWRTASPRTALDFAWLHLLRGNFGQIPAYLGQAEAALAHLDPAAPGIQALQAERLAFVSNLRQIQGDAAGSLQAAQRALELVPPGDLRVIGLAYLGQGAAQRQTGEFDAAAGTLQQAVAASQAAGDPVTGMLAVAHLTLMSLQFGRLHFAAGVAETALQHLESAAMALPPSAGAVYGALGLIYYEWNQVEQARAYLEKGIRLGSFSGHNASVIYSKSNLARLLQAEGDLDSAARLLQDAAGLLAQGAPGWVRPELALRQAALYLALGDSAAAETVLRQAGLPLEAPVSQQTDALHLAWLRLLAARSDPAAEQLAGRIRSAALAGGRNGTALQALVLGALLPASPAHDPLDWLAQALALAEGENCQRVFLDEGPLLATRLRRLPATRLRRLPATSFQQRLLAAFPAPAPALDSPVLGVGPVASDEAPFEPLSARELEVLRLLAQGLSYNEIAGSLVVSVNTVRYHVKGIYAKLGVDKQARAVERARSLGLL